MPAPDRAALEAMKRSDLQKLCKDYGVKANLKTEAIIDLLLDSVHHPHPIHRPASSYNNRPGTIAPPARQSQPPPSTARLPRPTITRQSQPPPSSRRPPPSQQAQPSTFLFQATIQPTATSSRDAPVVAPVPDQQHQASKLGQPNSNKPVSRRVSSRSSARARGVSTGSVIIHDTDDDDDDDDNNVNYQPVPPPPVSEPVVVAPTPRTRKAKEMQTRLGVGRPVIAGGTGARKSSSIPKPSRIRPSKTVKTVEATIEEEVLPEAEPSDQLSPIGDQQTALEQIARPNNSQVALSSADPLDERIQMATQPLRDQIEAMNIELSRLKLLEAHWSAAQEKIATLSNQVQQLQSEVNAIGSLKTQFLELKTMVTTGSISSAEVPHTSTPEELKKNPPAKENFVTPIGMSGIPSQPPAIAPHPGFAPRLLKRSHDSMSDIGGFVEVHDDDQTSEPGASQSDALPDKKRPKLTADTETSEPPAAKAPTNFHVSARAGYSIYTDVEPRPPPPSTGFDSPPRTDHLQLFGPGFGMSPDMTHDGPLIRAPMPPSDDAPSNPEPFGYPFMPTSTPAHSFFPSNLGPFPFPQAPQSPSPVGPARHYPGLPSRRPKSQPRDGGGIKPGSISDDDDDDDSDDVSEDDEGGAGSKQKDSASASKPSRKKAKAKKAPVVGRTLSSTEIGTQMGMIPVPIREGETHDNLPITRTLYGTELENDSRFGDFGVEGVASGFWTGGRF